MGSFVSTTYSFGRCLRDVLKWFEILQVQWILPHPSRYAGFDCLHASGRVQLHNHKDENMAAPHESDVVHVLSIQTTNVGVSTVAGSIMYALDIFLWFIGFIGHITNVRTFLTPETGTAMCDLKMSLPFSALLDRCEDMRGQFLTKALLKTNDGCKGGWLKDSLTQEKIR